MSNVDDLKTFLKGQPVGKKLFIATSQYATNTVAEGFTFDFHSTAQAVRSLIKQGYIYGECGWRYYEVTVNSIAMEVGDECFAVTDQFIIIPLRVIEIIEIELDNDENIFQVETEISCTPTGHTDCHHNSYFKFMWLDDLGFPDKGNVFSDKKDAVAYALKRAEDEVATKQKAIDNIQNQISKLRGDQNEKEKEC